MNFQRIRTDLCALGLLALTVFVGLSLVSFDPADPPAKIVYPVRSDVYNFAGPHGAWVAYHLRNAFGLAAYSLLLAGVAWMARLFSRDQLRGQIWRLLGSVMLLLAGCIAFQKYNPELGNGPVIGSGGYCGAWGLALLDRYLQPAGQIIVMGTLFLTGLVLADEAVVLRWAVNLLLAPLRFFDGIFTWIQGLSFDALLTRLATHTPTSHRSAIDDAEDIEYQKASDPEPAPRKLKINPPIFSRKKKTASIPQPSVSAGSQDYRLPDLDLLEDPENFPYDTLASKARIAAATLEQTFQEFGLNISVVEIDTGPVITQYEIELEKGLRLSKVTALADDLAIALRVPSVRVVAPIPGRNTVGIEVPNDKQVMVRLKELIDDCEEQNNKYRIPLFLGKDVTGTPLTVDMTKMPHLLIAGRTGTGKSVCLNTLILSILMTRTPEQVKMLMIDPKMVELSPYKRIPHLMHPVITDMKKAEAILSWAVDKMEERYDLLARVGVRHLDGYNKLGKAEVLDRLGIDPDSEEAEVIPETMPSIVIVADEMADMMMTSGKDVEGHIIRLAQKSRAVGIHLVLATQKPTVDIITGLIKSNLPARISFQVASRTDSRVVLDESGADKLLGNGDMLYLAPGTSILTRAQGTYVSDDEINNIIDFYSDCAPEYSEELAQITTASAAGGDGPDKDRLQDKLYEQAIDVVIREGRGSVSLLQRCLGIGYGRAARLIDYMAEDGIVGDYNGSQAREVLYTAEQWAELQESGELEGALV